MPILNYSSYAKAISLGVANPDLFPITEILIGSITNNEYFIDTFNKNEVYNITNTKSSLWCSNQANIPKSIKKAASSQAIESLLLDYFDEFLLPILIKAKEEQTYQRLLELIEADTVIKKDNKLALINLYNSNQLTEFLAETFIYAILADNKSKDTNDIQVTLNPKPIDFHIENSKKLQDFLNKTIKKKDLAPPSSIENKETIYIDELLKAYGNKENLEIFTKETLENYPRYKSNFLRQRKDFYSAESVKESVRDALGKDGLAEFNKLTEETHDAIIDVHEEEYANGFERLKKVTSHVTTVQLSKSSLNLIHGLISTSEKKGFCHMLVNNKKLKWVMEDE